MADDTPATLLRYLREAEGNIVYSRADCGFKGAALPSDPDEADAILVSAGQATDTYIRATTVRTDIPLGGRGTETHTHALVGLWADVDHDQGVHNRATHDARGNPLLPLPSPEVALDLLRELPVPTLILDTTGGYQAWWMLRSPVYADGDDVSQLKEAATTWGDGMHALGEKHGVHVDTVKDLARVLRVPGTHNHKWRHERGEDPRRVTVHFHDDARRYDLADLLDAIPRPPTDTSPEADPAPDRQAQVERQTAIDASPFVGPSNHPDIELWERVTTIEDLLLPLGWSTEGRIDPVSGGVEWTRPHKPPGERSAVWGGSGIPTLVVFSDAPETGLPSGEGQKLTLFKVFAELHHNGDHAAAGRAIAEWASRRDSEAPAAERERTAHSRIIDGASFIFDEPEDIPALWGGGDTVAAAVGEPTMLFGNSGVGKTTIAQQVVLARIGARAASVLGMNVARSDGRTLYLACDRPRQAARSLRRMVTPDDADLLSDRLTVWKGPLPFNLAEDPGGLTRMAKHVGADFVVVDSLKDIAAPLSDDTVGSRVNNALQELVAEDVDVLVLHHNRKATADNKKPNQISDVYGSTWLTAGMGSVLLVWGQAGDACVTVEHLKQPAEDVGPIKVLHDHAAGTSTVMDAVDLIALASQPSGLTAQQAAVAITGKVSPSRNEVEKGRRRLKGLADQGLLTERSRAPLAGGKPTSVWHGAQLAHLL